MVLETLKLAGLFLLVFIVMRLLGKGLLSQWTAYDLVTVIFLSYAALGAIKVQSFFHAIICITLIGSLYLTLSKLSLYEGLSRFTIGEPTILIKNGEIVQKNLKKVRYSITELLSTIRTFGYPVIEEIEYAILEPNGHISVIPKNNLRYLTPRDLDLNPEYTGLPITVIAEGKVKYESLTFINKTEEWLLSELEHNGYYSFNTIFYAYVRSHNHSLSIYPYK
ncbi:DUF421 domain-containing protein [Halalkalibacter flavus]|uniref:DUF421 domain-containing protein n=1 Tax=Halalkalibacter flavus TaxID=3090668 RepID=UPI002FC592C0